MRFSRKARSRPSINIAPLVDVVFLLVIFFAVSTTFLDNSGLKLDLPSSSSSADQETRELTVALAADGSISFMGERLDVDRLGERLSEVVGEADDKVVVLRADETSKHGEVVRIMDIIRESGAEALTIAAQRIEER